MTEISPASRRRGPYAKTAERRRGILEAADRVFATRGYHATSLREIAGATGMTLSNLQHHFPTKEDLLLEVLRQRDHADDGGEPLDADGFLAHVIERARSNEQVRNLIGLYSVLVGESTTDGHPGRAYFTERFTGLRDEYESYFADLRERGRLRAGVEPRLAASSLIALWDGIQLQWLLEPDRIDVVEHLEAFLSLVVASPAPGAQPADF